MNRKVFISLSALLRVLPTVPAHVLEDSLFFFGSKRFWLFPSSDEERQESGEQPTDYLGMDERFKELILRKEKRGEVCFLKPDVLGEPDEVVFGDYGKASEWLQGLGYGPLRLDPVWWETSGVASWRSVVNNFERGLHGYDAVSTLLVKSDARLEPVLYFSK